MKLRLALALLLPIAARAQLALDVCNGGAQTPVSQTYNYGAVFSGVTASAEFCAVNTGTAAITITTITVSGAGFSLYGAPTTYTLAGHASLNITVNFSASTIASYSANFQVTTAQSAISVILLASVVPSPVIEAFPNCQPTAGTGVVFPQTNIGTTTGCNFSIQNPSSQPITFTTIGLTGSSAFQLHGLSTPLTIAAGQTTMFSVNFTPVCGTVNYSAILTLNSLTVALTATGITPPLNNLSIVTDAGPYTSAQQHSVSLSLAAPAACATSGYINLSFQPSASGVTDDTAISFLAGSVRTLPISVAANSTQVNINGASSAMYQTGTTTGTINFSVSGVSSTSPPSAAVMIPASPIVIETATASNQIAGQLNITVVAYDNTYSAGAMSFTFLDSNGNAIGSPISSNFASNFKTYFAAQQSGSSFLMGLSFLVQGNSSEVAKVQVTLTNSAGQSQTGSLTFQ